MLIKNRVPVSDINAIQLRSGGSYNYELVNDLIGNHDGDSSYCYINGYTQSFYSQQQPPIFDYSTTWIPSEGSYLYGTIDEEYPDDNDYNYTDVAGSDEFEMGVFNIPAGRIIESVKIFIRAKQLDQVMISYT
jgi:hypothetical protein